MDMDLTENRHDLVDRYNDTVGPPGPQVAALQAQFLSGEFNQFRIAQYVQQCEDMIEARQSLRRKKSG